MNSYTLIKELKQITHDNIKAVQHFKTLKDDKLNAKPDAESWSILECIEHLNRYGDFYIPEITQRMNTSKHAAHEEFKTGILGNYFSNSMMPKEKLNTMKTFKSMNPINSQLDKSVLDKFLDQQNQTLELLEKAKDTNLTKVKTAISISKWIKLRLGDTFKVIIYHNLRHIKQAERLL